MKTEMPKIEEISKRNVAYVSFTGNYLGKPEVFANLFSKLYGWAVSKGLINEDSVFLAAYYHDPRTTPPEKLKLDICMNITDAAEVAGDIHKKALPGGQYVVMHAELTGREEYGFAWKAIADWADSNNYEMDISRPCYEIYLNNPKEHPEKHHILDICMSIKPKLRQG